MYKNEQDNALMSSSIASPLSNVMLREFCSLICAENNYYQQNTPKEKKSDTVSYLHVYICNIILNFDQRKGRIIFWCTC